MHMRVLETYEHEYYTYKKSMKPNASTHYDIHMYINV